MAKNRSRAKETKRKGIDFVENEQSRNPGTFETPLQTKRRQTTAVSQSSLSTLAGVAPFPTMPGHNITHAHDEEILPSHRVFPF